MSSSTLQATKGNVASDCVDVAITPPVLLENTASPNEGDRVGNKASGKGSSHLRLASRMLSGGTSESNDKDWIT